ncbi:MAG: NUDIX domain-containing protein, partial [Bacteroidota bacterium]
YKKEIQRALDTTDYGKNVFVMIKYRDNNEDLREFILDTLASHGFKGVLADRPEWKLTGDSVVNPLAVLYCCKYGIAFFDEPEDNQFYNPNVAYELGIMHYQNKECMIFIREEIKQQKPFDILSKLHQEYKDNLEVKKHIKKWVASIKAEEYRLEKEKRRQKEKGNRKVVVALIKKKNGQFLLTRRRIPEGKFVWGFPAKTMMDSTSVKKYFPPACVSETGITPIVRKRIGSRFHPNTKRQVEYWLCDYEKGRINILDPDELSELRWVSGKKAQKLITSDLFEPLKGILNGRDN